MLTNDGVEEICLFEESLRKIKRIKEEKYDTWEWNFDKSLVYTFSNKKYFPGGSVEVRLFVEKGIIQEIIFYGDFLSKTSLRHLCENLKWVLYEKKYIQKILESFPLNEYFGNITVQEILTVFLIKIIYVFE